MKIIMVDNFDRETVDDHLIADSVAQAYAEPIAEFMNSTFSGDAAQSFFRAVPDNHKLHTFEP